MRNLSLDQLLALSEVVELGSFSAAARRLNLTQPAVSLQIRELETRFGVRLVERLGKKAFATPAGLELIEHARRLLDEADRASQSMRRHSEGWLGRVRIGMSLTVLMYLMPGPLKQLRRHYPNIDIVIKTGLTEATVEGVRENKLDLGLGTLPIDDKSVEVTPLCTDQIMAVFPLEAPDAPAKVDPHFFVRQPLILGNERSSLRRLLNRWMTASGTLPKPVMELDNLEAIKSVVAAGLGISAMPSLAVASGTAARDLVIRPLKPQLPRTIGMIRRRDKIIGDAARHVQNAIMQLKNVRPDR